MKKLMFVFAAVAMAVAAQASSVKWGLNSGQTLSDISSGTAYLMIGSLPDTTGWDKKTSFALTDLTGDKFREGIVAGGAFVSDVESITSPVATYTVYMAVISDDGKTAAISTSTKSLRIAAAATPVNLQWASSGFTTYSSSSPVPEPTSGLLLLVGGAILGLRRKRA